ncbi:MAG: hypothetical protein WED00_18105 [Aquisalimonadaceae bacterium]
MTSDAQRALRKRIREHFSRGSVHPDDQTRITLFVQSVKAINGAVLVKAEFQPLNWLPYRALHNQYYKEVELATLLGKATAWSADPFLYMEATNLNLELWNRTGAARYLQSAFELDATFYRYLALSHAFMSVVRLLPLFPSTMPLDTPFLQALKEVEEENGRQIQVQIRLLKTVDCGLSREEREQIVEQEQAGVEACFNEFLARISPPEKGR